MSEIIALKVPIEEDLAIFSRYLWQSGVAHRIIERGIHQHVLVAKNSDEEKVQALYSELKSNNITLSEQPLSEAEATTARAHAKAQSESRKAHYIEAFWRSKIVYLGIALSIIGALLVEYDSGVRILRWLSYFDLEDMLSGRKTDLTDGLYSGEYWRVFTPMFLHFGALHVVFNMLWFWEFGRRMEAVLGSMLMLSVVLTIGGLSNIAQAWYGGFGFFGGMSGVVYGLLGFCWCWDKVHSGYKFAIRPAIVGFMMLWLLLCLFGVVTALQFGSIANAAHVGGLLVGAFLGIVFGMLIPSERSRKSMNEAG